jgi:hypothetical protein
MRRPAPLVGTWGVTLRWSEKTREQVGGLREIEAEARLAWLEQGGVLHYELGPSHWFIRGEEDPDGYVVL